MAGEERNASLRRLLELFALSGFAVARPLFDHLGRNATELVVGAHSTVQIVVMVVLVLVVPPLVAWSLEWVVGLVSARGRRWLHLGFVGLAGVIITTAALKPRTGLGVVPLLFLGVVAGLALGAAYARFSPVRQWLRVLALAPPVFAVLLLVASPVADVVGGGDPTVEHVAVAHPHRVVMVVMDEFPLESLLDGTGHVDAALFPNFAALAGASTWYRNSTTVSPITDTAVPAIMDGRQPRTATTLPTTTNHPRSIFTLLGGVYDLNVHETITRVCPVQLCRRTRPAGAGADLLRSVARDWWTLVSPSRTAVAPFEIAMGPAAQRAGGPFVRSLRRTGAPAFDFLHVALPHQEWRFLGTGQDNHGVAAPGVLMSGDRFPTPTWANAWSAESGRQAHLLQVQATDRLIGQIVARLRRIHALDDTMLVVTADHGVAFQAGQPLRGVSATNQAEILWTPLFVKYPGQRSGRIDDRLARSVDVVPTIADQLGIDLPWKVDGRSLRGRPRTTTTARVVDWDWSTIHPRRGRYLTFDARRGFATALRARATSATGDPALRLYRVGPYGGLIGTTTPDPAGETHHGYAVVGDALRAPLDPEAHDVPWTRPGGKLAYIAPGSWLAISVDGRVAGLAQAYRDEEGQVIYWAELPPQFFRAGRNRIDVWVVGGSPLAPRLVPVASDPSGT